MTDKERLEMIKHDFEERGQYGGFIDDYDTQWLMEQAEKVEELEQELILAYKSRKNGGMFWAGELNAINKRLEELECE